MWALHNLHAEGLHVEADAQAAQTWLERVAEMGGGGAAGKLASQLETGHPLAPPADRVMSLLLLAAESDDIEAQQQLGQLYFEGRHTPPNMSEALRWFGRAAINGAPFAQAWLGDVLSNGDGVIRDPAAAMDWYRRAAEGGFLPALSIVTDEAASSTPEEQQRIFSLWLAAAEAGDGLAQRMVGDLTLRGVGTEASPDQAAAWLRRAADQGDTPAKIILASLYLQDQAAPRDANEPIDLLRQAAEQGDADAQYNLGVCHQLGLRVERDLALAEQLYRQAATKNQTPAQVALADVLLETSTAETDQAPEAARWYAAAAKSGSARAMLSLGWLHEHGRGAPRDLARARQYYQNAADQGPGRGTPGAAAPRLGAIPRLGSPQIDVKLTARLSGLSPDLQPPLHKGSSSDRPAAIDHDTRSPCVRIESIRTHDGDRMQD